MANSGVFCDTIGPCTWYRGLFLCPSETGEEMSGRKFASFLEQLKDELSTILVMEGGDRARLMKELVRFVARLGMTEEDLLSVASFEQGCQMAIARYLDCICSALPA